MKFTRILGVAAALAAASVMAQEAAVVRAAPETQAAPVSTLDEDNAPGSPGDATAGASKAAACGACHGLDGNSVDPQYPKLAGQHERYIARQLSLYKGGERQNAIMLGFASTLRAQDMRDIGAYFASQKVVPGTADESLVAAGPNQGRKFYQVGERLFRAGNPAQGVPACQACHGPAGAGIPGPYPSLGGQHSTYTAQQLTAFRDGAVWGKDKNANAVMAGVASNLSDEEIQGLATYIEGLHNVADAPSAEDLAKAAAAAPVEAAPAADEAAPAADTAEQSAPQG